MVSSEVPPPVVHAVEAAVTVHEALSAARSSVTVMTPVAPEMVVPGAPLPRFALAGAVSDSAPVVTAKVTVVLGSLPGGVFEKKYVCVSGLNAAADAADGYSAI